MTHNKLTTHCIAKFSKKNTGSRLHCNHFLFFPSCVFWLLSVAVELDRTVLCSAICRSNSLIASWIAASKLEFIFRPLCSMHCRVCFKDSNYKKAQLSLTNPRDAKACQKLLQFYVLTMLSLTILVYLHLFSCCCDEIYEIRRNSLKIQTYRVQGHPRSSILVSIESAYATSY